MAVTAPEHPAVVVPAFVGPVEPPAYLRSPVDVDVEARTQLGEAPARERVSRAAVRPARKVRKVAHRAPAARKSSAVKRASSSTRAKRSTSSRSVRHAAVKSNKRVRKSNVGARRGMAAVLAYARAQVGDSYRMNATGPNVWDCSGLTQAAYRRAGIRLPHSSGAQAARAYTVSRSQARPGDLVVGPGHVGIYMGGGMMIDAGNRRVGVSYRRMYRGLWIERLR